MRTRRGCLQSNGTIAIPRCALSKAHPQRRRQNTRPPRAQPFGKGVAIKGNGFGRLRQPSHPACTFRCSHVLGKTTPNILCAPPFCLPFVAVPNGVVHAVPPRVVLNGVLVAHARQIILNTTIRRGFVAPFRSPFAFPPPPSRPPGPFPPKLAKSSQMGGTTQCWRSNVQWKDSMDTLR